MSLTTRLANPGQFDRLAAWLIPWLATAGVAAFAVGLYLALFHSPTDYQQGETVRIMYVHVPAAWLGLGIYVAMAIAAAIGLVLRHTLTDVFCTAAAPVGAMFVALCLATGSLWGRPSWGAWWAWDARMTSVLVLFLLYCGYIVLRSSFDDHERGSKAGAILLLMGAVNVPIVRFSVDWWNTLHQPASVLRLSGSTIDAQMLHPLLIMGLAYACYAASIILVRMRTVILQRRAETSLLLDES
ncbi:MAG: heme ABC transporter permease [Pseudomonadota bacterium]|nr:heme ABC transporter permease [Pseudomonadota bacterium]